MKLSRIFLLFGLMVFLIGPANAWEQSFEGHPSDSPLSDLSGYSISGIPFGGEHGSCSKQAYESTLTINKPFGSAFTASIYPDAGGSADFPILRIKMYNTDGICYFDKSLQSGYQGSWQRIGLYETDAGTGINFYLNGVFQSSEGYSTSKGTPKNMSIYFGRLGYTITNVYVDSISSQDAIIDCDGSASLSEGQYYKIGYPAYSGVTWSARIVSPDGRTYTDNVSSLAEHQILGSFLNESGQYLIKLYQKSESGHDYLISSRFFQYIAPGSDYISADKSDYLPGETINVYTEVADYSGYSVSIPYTDSAGVLKYYTYDLTGSEQTGSFTIPATARGGSHFIHLYDADNKAVGFVQYNCLASGGQAYLTIDKTTYSKDDNVKISYFNMPDGAVIKLNVKQGGTSLTSNTWSAVSGSGVVTYQLNSPTADNLQIYGYYGSTMYSQVTANILTGIYYLSGYILDSTTNAPIAGAGLIIGTSSTLSDAQGHFNFSVPAGWQTSTITKTGYETNSGRVNIVYPVASQNFYLVPSYTSISGSSLYGIISDYYTGAPAGSAYITVSQGSTTYSQLARSDSGYFAFDKANMSGNWTVTVTKTGYHSFSKTVTVSGDTYYQVLLTPEKYSSTGDTGSSDDSGGSGGSGGSDGSGGSGLDSSGTSSTDRPGRAAAKGAMEQFESIVPALIPFVILKVLMELF